MKTMTISILAILAILNLSCSDKNTDAKDSGILEQTVEKTSEVVNQTMEEVSEEDNEIQVRESSPPVSSGKTPRVEEKTIVEESTSQTKIEEEREWPIEEAIKVNETEADEDIEEEVETLEGDLNSSDERSSMVKPDHSVFDDILSANVSSKGVVNYKGIKSSQPKLDNYLKDLEANPVQESWSRDEQLAYWINAYNAYTIKLILDHQPVNSIQDIANGKPWDKKWIQIGGKTYSLNQIENDIIRPQFNEPRIHFAVNCAAQSCPPLANKAFTAENLNSLLEKQTKAFINNDKYNTIEKNNVKISKIFDWYGKDFGDKIAFLNKYSNTEISSGAKVEYTEYDWALNN